MHPAFSVIFFTTLTGAGYGLLGLLGTGVVFRFVPDHAHLGMYGIGIALGLITTGLLSSTFHLGHPERAWRALSQWRSSWLSREGIFAILTFFPSILFAYEWIIMERQGLIQSISGIVTAAFCLATVFTTAMIYASLKTITAWNNQWVAPVYITFALMSGATIYVALLAWFGYYQVWTTGFACITIIITGLLKLKYWSHIDNTPLKSSTESATGMGRFGKVQQLQSPHTQQNYLMQEMGYEIARRHSVKLRRLALTLGFITPLVLLALSFIDIPVFRLAGVTIAVSVMLFGILIERWLFFAEAKHTVMLYY